MDATKLASILSNIRKKHMQIAFRNNMNELARHPRHFRMTDMAIIAASFIVEDKSQKLAKRLHNALVAATLITGEPALSIHDQGYARTLAKVLEHYLENRRPGGKLPVNHTCFPEAVQEILTRPDSGDQMRRVVDMAVFAGEAFGKWFRKTENAKSPHEIENAVNAGLPSANTEFVRGGVMALRDLTYHVKSVAASRPSDQYRRVAQLMVRGTPDVFFELERQYGAAAGPESFYEDTPDANHVMNIRRSKAREALIRMDQDTIIEVEIFRINPQSTPYFITCLRMTTDPGVICSATKDQDVDIFYMLDLLKSGPQELQTLKEKLTTQNKEARRREKEEIMSEVRGDGWKAGDDSEDQWPTIHQVMQCIEQLRDYGWVDVNSVPVQTDHSPVSQQQVALSHRGWRVLRYADAPAPSP